MKQAHCCRHSVLGHPQVHTAGSSLSCGLLHMCFVQNERDVIEVFSLQMPCIFEGILQNEKVLRVIGTLFGSVPMGLSFARVCTAPSLRACVEESLQLVDPQTPCMVPIPFVCLQVLLHYIVHKRLTSLAQPFSKVCISL